MLRWLWLGLLAVLSVAPDDSPQAMYDALYASQDWLAHIKPEMAVTKKPPCRDKAMKLARYFKNRLRLMDNGAYAWEYWGAKEGRGRVNPLGGCITQNLQPPRSLATSATPSRASP